MRRAVSLDGLLFALVLALLVSLPFEPVRPLASLGFLEVNHLKLLLAACGVVWLAQSVNKLRNRTHTEWRDPQNIAIAVFVSVAIVSAVLAPTHRGEALKFVGRLASGLLVVLVARQLVQARPDRVRSLLWAVSLGAGVSALLGFAEVGGIAAADPLLATFKLAPTHVGGDLRLSASFQYATIAAMYFELAAPLAVVLAVTSTRRWQRILGTTLGVLCGVAVALTLTRAGVAALTIALGVLLAFAWARSRLRALSLPTALAGGAMAIALAVLAVRLPDFNTRFGTENDWGWFAASYSAPASLSLEEAAPTPAVVTATNTGQAVWTSGGDHPFALAYRWLSADAGSQLSLPPTFIQLPTDVLPGQSIDVVVDVAAAQVPPGDYRLAWGMLEQRVLWFHDRGNPDAETLVHVAPDAAQAQGVNAVKEEPRSDLTAGIPPVPRTELWRAAGLMFVQRPLIGVGPDNFRHVYGAYLGMPAWDERVHANNLYLELLADMGLLGAGAFAFVLAPALSGLVRSLRTAPNLFMAGLGAALVAFFVHGALDYFLDFTPIYVLFWLIVGLSTGLARLLEKQCS